MPGFPSRDASATTTVAYRDLRDRGSHRRAFPKGRRANRSRPNLHHQWPRRLAYTTTRGDPTCSWSPVGAMSRPCMDAARCLSEEQIGVTVVDPQWVCVRPGTDRAGWPPSRSPCVSKIRCRRIGAHLSHRADTRGRTYTLGLPPVPFPASRDHIPFQPRTHRPQSAQRCKSLPTHPWSWTRRPS